MMMDTITSTNPHRPIAPSPGNRLLLCMLLCGLLGGLPSHTEAASTVPAAPRNIDDSDADLDASSETDLTQFYGDEEMVRIATGTAKPVRLAPSVTSVITAREIKAMGWRTLDQALESVPGLHIAPSSLNRLNSIISMRGIHTGENSQLMMLINGMAINDLQNGGRPPRFTMPIENISRIEIIRGPGSAVFGADAFAGVINIITKGASELNGMQTGSRLGSFNTQDVWAQYGGQLNEWSIALSTEYSHSNGDNRRVVNADQQTTLDQQHGTSASLAPGTLQTQYRLLNTSVTAQRDNWNIWLNSWNLDDAGVGAGSAQAIDPAGKQDANLYNLKADYKNNNFTEHTELAAQAYHRVLDQQAYFRIFPPGTNLPIGNDGNLFTPSTNCGTTPCMVTFTDGVWGNPGSRIEESKFEVSATHSGIDRHVIRTAAGIIHSRFEPRESKNFGPGVINGTISPIDATLTDVTHSAVYSPTTSRVVGYLSLQDEWQLGRDWALTAGLRHDNYSDFGGTTNPRLALVWNAGYNRTHKLLYGRAFRAPSFGELHFQNNPVLTGNKNLKPETIDMLEFTTDYLPTFDVRTQVNFFAYKSRDLIEYVAGIAQNRGEQTGKGVETEASWQASNRLQLKGNLAVQYSESDITGAAVPDAPRRQVYLAAIWKATQNLTASAQTKGISGRSRAITDTRPAIANYAVTNLTLRYRPLGAKWEVTGMAYNLFNHRFYEPSDGKIRGDYPMEGRAIFVEGRYNFE